MTAKEAMDIVAAAHGRGARADLRDADLRDADLRVADLGGANLGGANLWGANLRDADLGDANIGGANLGGANLGGARILQLGPMGSRQDYLVFVAYADGTEDVATGCFRGSMAEFAARVQDNYPQADSAHGRAYRAAIVMWLAMKPEAPRTEGLG
jgi:hypothetical protein